VDAKRDRADGAELDKVFALDVVHFDVTVKPSREFRRHERFELLVPGAAGETAGYEECLVTGRNAQTLEL
jgi:hypothetical protein